MNPFTFSIKFNFETLLLHRKLEQYQKFESSYLNEVNKGVVYMGSFGKKETATRAQLMEEKQLLFLQVKVTALVNERCITSKTYMLLSVGGRFYFC